MSWIHKRSTAAVGLTLGVVLAMFGPFGLAVGSYSDVGSYSYEDIACEPEGEPQEGLTNMGFETGDLEGWTRGTVVDEVDVVGEELPYASPWEGASMARLGSTAPDADHTQPQGQNAICQDFLVDSEQESFAFNIFTYDYTGFDEFRFDITLIDPAEEEILETFSHGSWGSDTDLKSTGWRGFTLDLSTRSPGELVRLAFTAGGSQDELYPFWVYLDSAEQDVPPPCEQDPCGEEEPPCEGEDCEPCEGEDCEPPCEGDDWWCEESGLRVTKTDQFYDEETDQWYGDPVEPGGEIRYGIQVHNNSSMPATNVLVTDNLPAGLTDINFDDGDDGSDPCTLVGLLFECALGELEPDRVWWIWVSATAPEEETVLVNTVEITGDSEAEDDPFDNSFSEATTIGDPPRADLGIDKSGPRFVAAGSTAAYDMWLYNDGPDDVGDVTVRDTLPPGFEVTGTEIFGEPADCDDAAGVLTCTVDLSEGEIDLRIEGTIAADVVEGALVSNTAEIASVDPLADPELWNNRSRARSRVVAEGSADLSVDKWGPRFAVAGVSLDYELYVSNGGPAAAEDAVVIDQLPEGVEFLSASFFGDAGEGTCEPPDGQTLVCELGTLPADGWVNIDVEVTAGEALEIGSTIENSASISADEASPDPDEDNNVSDWSSQIVEAGSVDLDIYKWGDDVAAAGSPYSYYIEVWNNGPDTAQGAEVQDTLPPGMTGVSVASEDAACGLDGQIVTCSIDDLGRHDFVEIEIVVQPQAALIGEIVENTASVLHGKELDPDNNESSFEIEVLPPGATDIGVWKWATSDYAGKGQNLSYGIYVENNGPSDADDIQVVDTLPAGTTFVSTSRPGDCTHAAGVVTCSIDLDADDSTSFTITVAVAIDAADVLTNRVAVSHPEDPVDWNDSDRVDITAYGPGNADVGVYKYGPSTGSVGTPYTYVLVAYNDGPFPATGVVLRDTLPSGMAFVSTSRSNICSHDTGVVTCNVGSISVGGWVSIALTATPTESGTKTNTISLLPTTSNDLASWNNEDTLPITVHAAGSADLTISKVDSSDPVTAGSTFKYTIRVFNWGPSTATGVMVEDELPAGLTGVSATATPGGACPAPVDGTVTCAIGSLAPWYGATVTITATAPSEGAPLDLSNVARVSSTSPDPIDQNEVTETTRVNRMVTSPPPVPPTSTTGSVSTDPATGQSTVSMQWSTASAVTIPALPNCGEGVTPDSVTLKLVAPWGTTLFTSAMTGPDGAGVYTATVPQSQVQTGQAVIVVKCPDEDPVENPGPKIVLYDPSGDVKDQHGNAVEGAKVTLYKVPGWSAREGPGDNELPNTCESNESKVEGAAWSQPVTDAIQALSVQADPGSGEISPAINPQYTNAVGRYGWDVAAGCWWVKVEKEGYTTVISSVVGVPPEVTDLDVGLILIGYQPDAIVRLGTKQKGAGVYTPPAPLPTLSSTAKRRKSKTFTITIENDGSVMDDFTLKGPKSPKGFTITYKDGATKITPLVTSAGGFSIADLAPGASKDITVTIKVGKKTKIGKTATAKLTATSLGDATKKDSATAKLKVVK